MPLKFLKKLADKLLGNVSAEKTDARKDAHGRGGVTHGKPERSGQKHDPDGKNSSRWAARTSRNTDRPNGPRNAGTRDSSGRGGRDGASNRSRPPRGSAPAGEAGAASQPRGPGHQHPRGDSPLPQRGPRPDRPPRADRPPRQERPPRTQDAESVRPQEAPAERRHESSRPGERPPHSVRPVARPGENSRRDRDAGDRMNTASDRQRPGGAIGDTELEKRRVGHAAWSLDLYQVPEVEGKKRFHDFDLPAEIMHAVADKGFQYCTPIQEMSLVHALAGKNVAGKAQTGTGKTAAFLVAILTRYLRTPEGRADKGGRPRALVIAPTRELVIQICKDADELGKYCGLRSLAVYGGMDYERQKREVMDEPVDLLVATPGRLLDFARSRVIDLSMVDTLVIDEADRMLDMGFIPDVRTIIRKLPPKEKRGTMLYSATLSEDVMQLASQWMEEPVRVETEVEQVTTKSVKQVVYVVTSDEKFTVLYNHIQQFPESRILVFCNRRTTTDDVADSLERRGVRCETLSGDVNQNRRLRVLEDFRSGKVRIVVATDVAGRGLHVDDIGFVINFDFPYAPEDYVHRIGRTGRAGASGVAISFADEDESFTIPEIEKYINEELKCTLLKADDPLLTPVPKVSRREHHRAHPGETAPAPESQAEQESVEIPVGEEQAPASAFITETTPAAAAAAELAPAAEPVRPADEPAPRVVTEEVRPAVVPPVSEKHPTVVDVQPVKPVKVDKPEHKAPHFTRPVEHVAAPVVAPAPKSAAPEAPHFTRHVEQVAAPVVAPAPKSATPGRPARFSEEWVPGGEK